MRSDIVGGILALAALGAALFAFYLAHRLGSRAKLRITEHLKTYFNGEVPVERIGKRIRETSGYYFVREAELFSLVTAAFQRAADTRHAARARSEEDERHLLNLLSALKIEFGLPDRYRIEGWRAGRE